jgi:hypothetical protein
MLWRILSGQPYEQRVATIAEAGYRSVNLVREFDQWSTSEFERFARVRESRGISLDPICLSTPGCSNP